MIHDLKPYPAYKDSGVPWLGKIPNTWRVLRGKNVFRVIDVRSKTGDEELLTVSSKDGVVPRSQKTVTMFKAESYMGHKLCWPGDLVINSLWAWMQGLGFTKYHGLVSSAYSVYRPLPEFSSYANYFDYILRSAAYKWELQTRSKGVWLSRLQLSDPAFLDMPLVIPPADEQSAIVRYLDHFDRRIRRYIHAKKKFIKLLEEQKQAIIHQAVTRGLDPNVKLKPSGVEWLGDIPEHWDIVSLGAASELIQTGPFGSQLHSYEYIEGGVPVINPSHMQNGNIVPDVSISISQSKADSLQRHKLQPGDIVAARRGELGRCALVTTIEEGWICGTGSLRICCKKSVFCPEYFLQLFSSQGIRDSLNTSSIGATMDNLNSGMVSRLRLPLPSLDEQHHIVELINLENKKNDLAISAVKQEISLLREYRTRLIADVVTGKLDVREAATSFPKEIEHIDSHDLDENFFNFEALEEEFSGGETSED